MILKRRMKVSWLKKGKYEYQSRKEMGNEPIIFRIRLITETNTNKLKTTKFGALLLNIIVLVIFMARQKKCIFWIIIEMIQNV